jgi:hypothetical protein
MIHRKQRLCWRRSVDLHGHLVVGAADALGADLDVGPDVAEGEVEHLERRGGKALGLLLVDPLLDDVEGAVNAKLGPGLLAVAHHAVDELRQRLVLMDGIGAQLLFGLGDSSGHGGVSFWLIRPARFVLSGACRSPRSGERSSFAGSRRPNGGRGVGGAAGTAITCLGGCECWVVMRGGSPGEAAGWSIRATRRNRPRLILPFSPSPRPNARRRGGGARGEAHLPFLVPYLERPFLRASTPRVSSEPRTMW